MYKPVLMIHRVEDWMFDLPLAKFVLTFDDGYRDHWDTFEKFLSISTEKIYFITGAWTGQENFLTVSQIHDMRNHRDVTIGAHGFHHSRIARSGLQQMIDAMVSDTEATVQWFKQNFGLVPSKFCFPYNDNVHGLYTNILKCYGFQDFYGPERIDVNWLRDPEWVASNAPWILP